jgi:hypothetical protein
VNRNRDTTSGLAHNPDVLDLGVKLTMTEKHWNDAAQVAKLRQAAAIEKRRPSAHGYNENDPLAVHLVGAIAELAVSLVLNQPWHAFLDDLNISGQKPPDVGENVQVRSTKYKSGNLLLHPGDHEADIFVLVVVTDRDLRIVGWIEGKTGKNARYWGDKQNNKRPAFWVPQSDLNPPQSLFAQFPGAPFFKT